MFAHEYLLENLGKCLCNLKTVDGTLLLIYRQHIILVFTKDTWRLTLILDQNFLSMSIAEGVKMILGLSWLRAAKPLIDWKAKNFSFSDSAKQAFLLFKINLLAKIFQVLAATKGTFGSRYSILDKALIHIANHVNNYKTKAKPIGAYGTARPSKSLSNSFQKFDFTANIKVNSSAYWFEHVSFAAPSN